MIKEQTSRQGARRGPGGEEHSLRGRLDQDKSDSRAEIEDRAPGTGALPEPGDIDLVSPGCLKNIQEGLMEARHHI